MLHPALARRNLSFSHITISEHNFPPSMDLGTPPYYGSLNKNTDAGNLAGKFLIVSGMNFILRYFCCFHFCSDFSMKCARIGLLRLL